ncbi:MAG: hypothetical protein H3C64_02325 [Candidatus Kuenenia stuttgartiensis]|nr:hypothetical protein [Candidatus Kuenenia stuttgartiensis]
MKALENGYRTADLANKTTQEGKILLTSQMGDKVVEYLMVKSETNSNDKMI